MINDDNENILSYQAPTEFFIIIKEWTWTKFI